MATQKTLLLACIYLVGLGVLLSDFVLQGIHGVTWCLIAPPLAMLGAFFICGWSTIKESTCDAMGWGLISVLALLSLFLNIQGASTEEASIYAQNGPMLTIAVLMLLISLVMAARATADSHI